jgi:hypothetical protein
MLLFWLSIPQVALVLYARTHRWHRSTIEKDFRLYNAELNIKSSGLTMCIGHIILTEKAKIFAYHYTSSESGQPQGAMKVSVAAPTATRGSRYE